MVAAKGRAKNVPASTFFTYCLKASYADIYIVRFYGFLFLVESEKMVIRILLVLALILAALFFSGCQTVQGVGRDITWTGEAGAEFIDNIIYPPHKNQQPKIVRENY